MPSKSINYKKAIKQPPKEPQRTIFGIDMYDETLVKWDPSIEVPQKVNLKTIGELEIILPPELPAGYAMVRHPSWDEILPKLIDETKTYPPQYIFHFEIDVRYIKSLGVSLMMGDLDHHIEKETYSNYGDWLVKHSDTWYDLKEEVFNLFCKATGFPKGSGEMDLPDDPAPSIKKTLDKMMRLIE